MELEKTPPDAAAVLRLWMCSQMNSVKTNLWAQIKKVFVTKKNNNNKMKMSQRK